MSIRQRVARWLGKTMTYREIIAAFLMAQVLRVLGHFYGDGLVLGGAFIVMVLCYGLAWVLERRVAR